MTLGLSVYQCSASFPAEERFGLTAQMRRGAIAVASNIAEGYGRGSTADYIRFLKVARGALYELDTQVLFANRLGYLNPDDLPSLKEQWAECERVLAGLIRSLTKGRS